MSEFQQGFFRFDDSGSVFPGYRDAAATDLAYPYFDNQIAENILRHCWAKYHYVWWRDQEVYWLAATDQGCIHTEQAASYPPTILSVEGQARTMYAIGSHWPWQEVQDGLVWELDFLDPDEEDSKGRHEVFYVYHDPILELPDVEFEDIELLPSDGSLESVD